MSTLDIRDVKVYYKSPDCINDEFEFELDTLMLRFNLERWASGYGCGERDIAYDIIEEE